MDAMACVIAHEELSASDPAFCLSFLAHSMLFVNNLAQNGSEEQCAKYLRSACSGSTIGGMGMSEPMVGTDVLSMKVAQMKRNSVEDPSGLWLTFDCIDRHLPKSWTMGPGN